MKRWVRRLLGIDEILQRLARLEEHSQTRLAHDPEKQRAAVSAAFARDPLPVAPGPSTHDHYDYYPEVHIGLYL